MESCCLAGFIQQTCQEAFGPLVAGLGLGYQHAVAIGTSLRGCVQVTYSTYVEADYDAIWKHYAYLPELPDWFYKVTAHRMTTNRQSQLTLAAVWAPQSAALMPAECLDQDFGMLNCSHLLRDGHAAVSSMV